MIQSHIHWHHREELNQDLTFQTVPFNSIPLEMGFELHISVLRLRLKLGLPFRVLFPSHQHSWIASWRAWAFVVFLSYSISANSAASESRAPSWHWVTSWVFMFNLNLNAHHCASDDSHGVRVSGQAMKLRWQTWMMQPIDSKPANIRVTGKLMPSPCIALLPGWPGPRPGKVRGPKI